MAKLTPAQQQFIVERFAVYDPPKRIMTAFREEFGIPIERLQVQNYDIDSGRRQIAKGLVKIFEATRKKFHDELATIPIANRSFRLRRLNQLHDAAFESGNAVLAADLLEQAAKEAGDVFTNVSKVSGKVKHEADDDVAFLAQERRATLADLVDQALRKTAPKTQPEVKH